MTSRVQYAWGVDFPEQQVKERLERLQREGKVSRALAQRFIGSSGVLIGFQIHEMVQLFVEQNTSEDDQVANAVVQAVFPVLQLHFMQQIVEVVYENRLVESGDLSQKLLALYNLVNNLGYDERVNQLSTGSAIALTEQIPEYLLKVVGPRMVELGRSRLSIFERNAEMLSGLLMTRAAIARRLVK